MLRSDWNSLEVGDRVMVHDTDDSEQRLMAGVVAAIEAAPGSAEVTIRVANGSGTRMIQPQRLTVHHDPVKFDSQCWRCAGSGPSSPTPTRHRPRYG